MDSECDSEGKHCILFVFTFLTALTGCCYPFSTHCETERVRERERGTKIDIWTLTDCQALLAQI